MVRWGSFILKDDRIQRLQLQIGGEHQNERRHDVESEVAQQQRQYPSERAELPGIVGAGQPPDYCASDEAGIGREVSAECGDFQRMLAVGADQVVRVRDDLSWRKECKAIRALARRHTHLLRTQLNSIPI